ncbi:MAG: ATP-binding protein [Myxococcota bacterium]
MTASSSLPPRRIARRVALVFLVVLALLGTALLATVRTFRQLSVAEQEAAALDFAKHTGHNVAGLVREQYIHQAHTIIAWDRSHVAHYQHAAEEAKQATLRLLAVPLIPSEQAEAQQIAALVDRIDRDFAQQILPAIDAGDHARVAELHEGTEQQVDRVVRLSEALNRKLEERAMEASAVEERLGRDAAVLVIGCFALAIVVTGAGWLVIGQSILRRLSDLRAAALKLASGNLDVRVPVRGTDEVADLASTFNDMAASLASKQESLLRAQRLAAIGQVAAGVAHEINNPLGVILGYVTLLQRPQAPPDGLRIIEDEVRQCQRIVQGLLDLAKPAGNRRDPVDLTELARDAVERLQEGGKLARRRVELPQLELSSLAVGDASALRQVVSNLLQNALEATADDGAIVVEARESNDAVELQVTDDGPGMSEDTRRKAFDPFFTTKATGTGLGLAISHAIVAAHEGAITLTSEPGKGTHAIVRLPRYTPVPERAGGA